MYMKTSTRRLNQLLLSSVNLEHNRKKTPSLGQQTDIKYVKKIEIRQYKPLSLRT